jgi:transposase InsO family protein
MQHYLATTCERLSQARGEKALTTGRRAAKQALRRAEEALREERYRVRERRKREDADWRALRKQFRDERTRWKAAGRPWPGKWNAWELRQAQVEERQREDAQWHTQRQQLRQQAQDAGQVSAWLAILVGIDNCTRQCFGLPLFVAGAQVTAQQVVDALEALLPAELQYLISDQGSHFRTRVFAQLAERQDFIWVPIARHRPQSNGIAERFVRTLKEGLADKAWQSSEELARLLAEFLPAYNDRPHQGLPIPGLSPNEFAQRIWLM